MHGAGAAQGARRAGRLALAGGIALVIVLRSVTLAAAASGPGALTLSVASCLPGDTVTITGAGQGGAGSLPILLAGPGTSFPLGTASANSAGAFTLTVTIPADTADGDYLITTFDTAEALVSAPLHVGAAITAAAPTTTTTATDETDQGTIDLGSGDDGGGATTASPSAPDPYPVPEDLRDIAFVLLVAGSLALAAWGAGMGRPR